MPPRRRDTRSLADRVRQDRQNLAQLGVGFVGGRMPALRPLGATELLGDIEDDEVFEVDTNQIAAWNTDIATATQAGIITLDLTFVPMDGSLHVRWNGLDQPHTEWSRSGQRVTFTDPRIRVGHVLDAAYLYYPSDIVEAEPEPPVPDAPTFDYESDWRYLFTTDQVVDYSSPTVDDSGWAVGQAGFYIHTGVTVSWPWHTPWPKYQLGWFRRDVGAGAAGRILSIRRTGQVHVYWDGVPVRDWTTGYSYTTVSTTSLNIPATAGELVINAYANVQGGFFDARLV
jgi:hypothetical protein